MTQGWDCSWDIEVWGKVHKGVFFYLKHSVTRHAYSASQILCAALCSCSCCKQSTDCFWPHTVVSRMCVWGIASEDRDDVSLQTGQWSLLSKIRSQFLSRVTTVSAGATDLPWHWPVKMGLCGSHLTGQIPPAPASTEGGELSVRLSGSMLLYSICKTLQRDLPVCKEGKARHPGSSNVCLSAFETESCYVCSPRCSGSLYVDQTGLELTQLSPPGLKVCAPTPG